ncbi:MAG: hypothetical protein WC819_04080, partial [Parcubacteria group bacterium]
QNYLTGLGSNAWNFSCEAKSSGTTTTPGTTTPGTTTPGTTTPGTTTPGTTTPGTTNEDTSTESGIVAGSGEQKIRDQLSDDNISVNKPAPTTEVNGLRQDTLDGVVDFQKEVGEPITITGGSEPHTSGTKSHANGYKVDIRPTSAVNNYIERNYKRTGTRSDGAAAYSDGKGSTYYKEGDHWDVCYKC